MNNPILCQVRALEGRLGCTRSEQNGIASTVNGSFCRKHLVGGPGQVGKVVCVITAREADLLQVAGIVGNSAGCQKGVGKATRLGLLRPKQVETGGGGRIGDGVPFNGVVVSGVYES